MPPRPTSSSSSSSSSFSSLWSRRERFLRCRRSFGSSLCRTTWCCKSAAKMGIHANVDLIQTKAEIPLLATRAWAALLFPRTNIPFVLRPIVVVLVRVVVDVYTEPPPRLRDDDVCRRGCCCGLCRCRGRRGGMTTIFVSMLSKLVRLCNCCKVA